MWGDFVRLFTHNVYSVRPKRGKQNFCTSMGQKFFIPLRAHSGTDGAHPAWPLALVQRAQPLHPRWEQRLMGGWVGNLSRPILVPGSLRFSLRFSLRPHCVLIAFSLRPRCVLIASSLRSHCVLVAFSLRSHCVLIAFSLRSHCVLIASSLRTSRMGRVDTSRHFWAVGRYAGLRAWLRAKMAACGREGKKLFCHRQNLISCAHALGN